MKRLSTLEELQASLGHGVRIKSVDGIAAEPRHPALMMPSGTLTEKPIGVKGIIRQSNIKANKTEIRFEMEKLLPMRSTGEVVSYRFNDITLRIANGLRYTPDYQAINGNGLTVFWEVKGAHIRDDALPKLKMAASTYPEYEFWLAQWKGGEWNIQRVLP